MLKTVSIIVTGRVQGVYYRQSTKEKAVELGITGEIRNMPDDTVSIIATGTEEKILQLKDWCKQGPPRARVVSVILEEISYEQFERFSIVR